MLRINKFLKGLNKFDPAINKFNYAVDNPDNLNYVNNGLSTIFPNTFGEINYDKTEDIIKKKQKTDTANFNIDKLGELIEDLVKEDFANYFNLQPDVVIRSFVNCKYNINATYFDLEASVYERINEFIELGKNPNPFHKNIQQGNDMRKVQFAEENPNAPSRLFPPQGMPPIRAFQQDNAPWSGNGQLSQQQLNSTFQNSEMRRLPPQRMMRDSGRPQSSSNYLSDNAQPSGQRFDQPSRLIEQRDEQLLQQMGQQVDQLVIPQIDTQNPTLREAPAYDQSKLRRLQTEFPTVVVTVLKTALIESENDYNKASARIKQRRRGSSGGQYYRKRKTRKPRKIRKPRKTRKN
jgi:hypothetical protein